MGLKDVLNKAVNAALEFKLRLFKKELKNALSTKFVDRYMEIFDRKYDELFVVPYNMSSKDQTSPQKIKPEVVAYVRGELVSKIGKISVDDRYFSIRAISRQAFGYPSGPDRSSTEKLKLFYFYLEGTPQEFVFITKEIYSILKPGKDTKFGRFGTVFLMPMREYRDKYRAAVSRGARGLPPPETIRHPFSGAPPINIFDQVIREIGGEKGLINFLKKFISK